jgi:hypothetical protein
VVAQYQTEGLSLLGDLFVTAGGTIYVADWCQGKVLAFHPSSETFTEVLQCPHGLEPLALFVQDRSLYVSMITKTSLYADSNVPEVGATYEYSLPPELQLE